MRSSRHSWLCESEKPCTSLVCRDPKKPAANSTHEQFLTPFLRNRTSIFKFVFSLPLFIVYIWPARTLMLLFFSRSVKPIPDECRHKSSQGIQFPDHVRICKHCARPYSHMLIHNTHTHTLTASQTRRCRIVRAPVQADSARV